MRSFRMSLVITLLSVCLYAGAQSVTNPSVSQTQPAPGPGNVAGLLYAANFAHWTVPPGQNGGFSWTSPAQCYGTSGGVTFKLFQAGQPITIVDNNPALTETVNVGSAQYGGWGCAVSLPTVNAHKSFYLQSGTAGLQEAANWAGAANAVIVITPDWSTLGGTTGNITSATLGANTQLVDCRTSNCVSYTGTTPTINVTGTGKDVFQTSPTLITPSLTSPTITGLASNSGYVNSSAQTVALTGADWSCGTGGITTSCTSFTTIGAGAAAGQTFSFTLPLSAQNWSLECEGVVGQATGATANQWGIQTATNGATNFTAWYNMNTAATAMTGGAVTDTASSTTATEITPAWTLGGTGTKMPFHIGATIEGSSASGTVVNVMLLAPTVADLVTIYRGAECHIY
jgi:hypothetical protein